MNKKKLLTVASLPFRSILDERPNKGQFVLVAWDIRGFSGFESIFWDIENKTCKNCVMWLPLSTSQLFTRDCGVTKRRRTRFKEVILKWSEHYSIIINNKYVSLDKLPKAASVTEWGVV